MLTFRPTKMLAARAHLRVPAGDLRIEDPYRDWCAHSFTAGRRRYLLLTNTYSFLSVVFSGAGLTSEAAFIRATVGALQRYLQESGRGDVFENFIGPHTDSIRWAKVPDRSVLGTMNELVFQAELYLTEMVIPLQSVSDRLNQVPLSVLWKRGNTSAPDRTFDALRVRPSDGERGSVTPGS